VNHAKTYALKPSSNTAGNQLLFKEAAQNIKKVLAANGYVKDEQSSWYASAQPLS
jgi:hypothetical protein